MKNEGEFLPPDSCREEPVSNEELLEFMPEALKDSIPKLSKRLVRKRIANILVKFIFENNRLPVSISSDQVGIFNKIKVTKDSEPTEPEDLISERVLCELMSKLPKKSISEAIRRAVELKTGQYLANLVDTIEAKESILKIFKRGFADETVITVDEDSSLFDLESQGQNT